MKTLFALLLCLCAYITQAQTTYRIVIIGSGAAAGAGASVSDSAWANRMQVFYRRNMSDNADTLIINRAVGYIDTWRARETGYVPPVGKPSPDGFNNITNALTYTPNLIIVNFPSDELTFGTTLAEQMANLRAISAVGTAGGATVWVTTTYPNNFLGQPGKETHRDVKDSIIAQFPTTHIELWSDFVDTDGFSLKASVANGTTHPNDLGHRLIFQRLVAGPPTDITPPTVTSASVSLGTPNQVTINFGEPVVATTAGWSFRRGGSNWVVSSVSGSGTTWTFTMSTNATAGQALDMSYNSGTGNTTDPSGNELVSFTNVGVANNISGTYQIPIPTNKPHDANFYNLNFDPTKNVKRIFDGNVATNINSNGVDNQYAGGQYAIYQSWVVMDSIYNISSFDWFIGSNNGGVRTFVFYDSLKQQIGDTINVTITGGFNNWKPATPIVRNGVKFIEVRIRTLLGVNDGMTELRFFGNATGPTGSILPTVPHNPASIIDHGTFAIGFNDVGDRWNRTSQSDITDTLYRRLGKIVRWYPLRNELDRFPEGYHGGLIVNQPLVLNRQGPTNNLPYYLGLLKRWGMLSNYAAGGPSLKSYSLTDAQNNNFWMGGFSLIGTNWRYMEPSANPEIDTSHAAGARQLANVAALYGNNQSTILTTTITGGASATGQNLLTQSEWDNEPTRFWVPQYYHTAKAYVAASKAYYDSVKARVPNFHVSAAAHVGLSYDFWKAIWFWNYWAYGSTIYPADGFSFNNYISTAGSGQGGDGNTLSGISPEQWGARQEAVTMESFFATYFPNKPAQWTEYGYDFRPESPYEAPAIGAKTARQVQADWETRLKAGMQTTRTINRMMNYAFFQDFSGPFGGMAMVGDEISFTRAVIFPKGYAQANELVVEENYNWFSQMLVNGGTTGVWVTRKDHRTDATKKMFKIWRGTSDGSTSNYVLDVTGASSVIRHSLSYTTYQPVSTSMTITGNSVTVPASEAMTWVEVTYAAANQPPTVNAGVDQTITLPTNSVTVTATASDPDGTIASRLWEKISGPSGGNITSSGNLSTTITSLSQGTYVYRITVTDNLGATASDNVQIVVNSSGANLPPTVFLGSDVSITLPTNIVSVTGTAIDSDGTISSVIWTKLSGPVSFTFSSPNTVNTTIQNLVEGVYVFRVTVTDNLGATGFDDIQIGVNPAPSTGIPVVTVRSIASNRSTASLTAVASDPGGSIVSYAWVQLSGPATATLQNANAATVNISNMGLVGNYEFRVTVTDNQGNQASAVGIVKRTNRFFLLRRRL